MSVLRRQVGLIEVPGQAPYFQFSGEPTRDIEEYRKVRARADKGEEGLYHLVVQLERFLGAALIGEATQRKILLNIDEPFVPFSPPVHWTTARERANAAHAVQVDLNREALARSAIGRALRGVAVAADSMAAALVCRTGEADAAAQLEVAVAKLNDVRKRHEVALQKMWSNI